jgi:fructose-1,6-bisphosphatase I
MASEEHEGIIEIPPEYDKGSYVLIFDPLDGSANIDLNVSIGTIFAIYKTIDWEKRGRLEDCLQPGRNLEAAGYVLYGSSTMMVYSTGAGVHGFTLDPELGEFLLSHKDMRFPEQPYYAKWSPGVQRYIRWLQGRDEPDAPRLSERYIGSLVADFHRNLLRGGVFAYPRESEKPEGKLRLLYEAAPLAYLAEQAGGYGSNGYRSILDIVPQSLHQRTPLFIGNRSLVERAELLIAGNG